MRTLKRIHQDEDLTFEVDVPPEARFQGERQDLEEMLGNLLDNACKWARSQVVHRRSPRASAGTDAQPRLSRRSTTTARASTTTSAEASASGACGSTRPSPAPASACRSSWISPQSYGGGFRLEASSHGGISARLELPAAAG